MAELKIPLDFERLPEYRLLRDAISVTVAETGSPYHPEMVTAFLFIRFWVDLAYQAALTNRPGWLNEAGHRLLSASISGTGCPSGALEKLVESGWLTPLPDGGYMCSRFARTNPHLAGNFKPMHLRGAELSAHARRKNTVAHEANTQAMLLPPTVFKKSDGTDLSATQVQRCLVLIKTLDNCLKLGARHTREFSEGLIADAASVIERFDAATLEQVYRWLIDTGREHPAVPQTTEQILAQFDLILEKMSVHQE